MKNKRLIAWISEITDINNLLSYFADYFAFCYIQNTSINNLTMQFKLGQISVHGIIFILLSCLTLISYILKIYSSE